MMEAPPATSKVKKIKIGDWEQLWDGKYSAAYYYNVKTKQSQWERPAAFPDLSAATAPPTWNDPSPVTKYIKVQMEAYQQRLMTRSARVQVDPDEAKKFYLQGGEDYNIWYDRFSGDHWRGDKNELSETRCKMATDCGATKANLRDPQGTRNFFCYHFAKGRCSKGPECTFFHRIPTQKDGERFDSSHDAFGRERHHEHRQDMGGTGSFQDDCKTLYVGGVAMDEATEGRLWRSFGEWGTPAKINIITRLNIAFVSYGTRANAEYAKAAMSGQGLEGSGALNIRWAYQDQNPTAQAEKAEEQQHAVLTAAERRGIFGDEGSKRQKLEPYAGQAVGYYPTKPSEAAAAATATVVGGGAAADSAEIGPAPQQVHAQLEQDRRIAASVSMLDRALSRADGEQPVMPAKRKAES